MKTVRIVAVLLTASVLLAVLAAGALSQDPAIYTGPDPLAQTAPGGPAKGPLRMLPANRRYLTTDGGKAVYLTGSHTWNSLQELGYSDPPQPFDFERYLGFLREHRHNFIRLWREEAAKFTEIDSKRLLFSTPHPWLRSDTQPALDGKPRFDLSKIDQTYFDRLRSRVEAAGRNGIYVSVMLFEGWVLRFAPDGWQGHPFNPANNVNGIDCDLNRDGKGLECFTLANPAVTRIQEAYVRKVIDTVNDLDNVLYEISNENHWDSHEWEAHFLEYVREYQKSKPKQHLVGLTSNGGGGLDDTSRLFASSADWISPNSLRDNYKENPPAAPGTAVVIPDTDHLWGLGGDRVWVWKSFLRGHNPIFMDPYLEQVQILARDSPRHQWEGLRRAMGHTAWFASRMDLKNMSPRPELASTGYCLANPGMEYLVYLPFEAHPLESARFFQRLGRPIRNFRWHFAREASVDLSPMSGEYTVEWFSTMNGETRRGESIFGGRRRTFTAPFAGDAVLYLKRRS